MNNPVVRRPARSAFARAAIAALLLALTASCSVVFRSSIQGTVIDSEDWADGTTTAVADAKVFLYTDAAARDQDFAAYVDDNEATLPDGVKLADGSARTEHLYFQSTVTDANGAYDFTGFIWEELFSDYGKTADRKEVFLLTYHPDYGLWKNPVPLYVVSDVTNQLDQIKIEDLWNQGRLAGTVTDWASGVEQDPLNGVTVNLYVADSWTFDAGVPVLADAKYPGTPTVTTTTDADGRWATTFRFRKMPGRDGDLGKAPVRIAYVLGNHRANQPTSDTTTYSPVFSNSGIITTVDLDKDGADADHGDYEDAFLYATAEYNLTAGEVKLVPVPNVMMQRWRYTAEVRGRVKDDTTPTANYLNNITVKLTITSSGELFTAYSEQQTTGETTVDGGFNLGTIVWYIENTSNKETGEVNVSMDTDSLDLIIGANGSASSLLPDTQRNLTLIVDATP